MSAPLPPLLLRGDCLAELKRIPDESVDAVICDPPYGLANTDPAHVVEALTRWAQGDRDFIPSGRGFMGKEWDAFVPPPAVWDECARILKPGGHLLAFAGSRTFDLMTLSIRFAGFEIRDSIAWLYGSGFPKSMDVSKAIDKSGGNAHLARPIAAAIKAARLAHGWTIGRADAEFCGGSTLYSWYEGRPKGIQTPTPTTFALMVEAWPELAPYADAVAEVEREVTGSHKSSIVVGTSGPTRSGEGKERHDLPATDAAREWEGWGTALKPAFEPVVVARKPLIGTVAANVLEHGTGALNIDATRLSALTADEVARSGKSTNGMFGLGEIDWKSEAKPHPGRWPANVALDESQAAALDEQSGHLRDGVAVKRNGVTSNGVTGWGKAAPGTADVAKGDGSGGGASRFFYVAKAPKSERPVVDGAAHPTVKPLALMRWLLRLVMPPGGCVVDPFAGSGTTLEAAYLEGFESIGVELTPEYWPLVAARIERVTR